MLSKGKKKKKIFNKLLGEGNNYLLSGMENQDFILIPIAQTTFKNTKIIKTEKKELKHSLIGETSKEKIFKGYKFC